MSAFSESDHLIAVVRLTRAVLKLKFFCHKTPLQSYTFLKFVKRFGLC